MFFLSQGPIHKASWYNTKAVYRTFLTLCLLFEVELDWQRWLTCPQRQMLAQCCLSEQISLRCVHPVTYGASYGPITRQSMTLKMFN